MKTTSLLLLFVIMTNHLLMADDFFTIKKTTYHSRQEWNSILFKEVEQTDKNNNTKVIHVFTPYLEAQVDVKAQANIATLTARAYFYDQDKKLISSVDAPVSGSGDVFFEPGKERSIYFILPDSVLGNTNWTALVVFGDAKGVDARSYPRIGEENEYTYQESKLYDREGPPIDRKPAMDPVVEYVVKTNNPRQPQITLFLRPPLGMTDAAQAKGVLCLSILANRVEDIKRQLQGFEPGQDVGGILKFAEDHKLIIICWGSHGLWDPRKNWDDLRPDDAWNADKDFDQVADAWARGVQYFVDQYSIPRNGYLLWGISGSAQYACRLALRKPEYFLAVHVHIPSSFDKPTPEANKILWCLTTGELEAGHQRSLRFYAQCRALGYPMIYKAIVGLGHHGNPIADELGARFFEYALGVRDQRFAYDDNQANPLSQLQTIQTNGNVAQPWIESFRKPAFMGDVVNQEMFPYGQMDMVPMGFRTPLPTKEIADAWNH